MSLPNFLRRHPHLFILTLPLLGVYLSTLAPGLTWANDGSDGGDLITAAYTGGVAHPTGYPLYLLLARLFQFIPLGSLAYRTNLLSALATTLTAALICKIVTRALDEQDAKHARLAGLIAGFAFGLAPLVWSQAVITEVNALQALLVSLILYLNSFQSPEGKRSDRTRGLVMGLAICNHVTALFLVPLAFIPDRRRNASSSTRKLLWLSMGLLLYLTLPLRASSDPPVNWGDPLTLERFWWLVSGGSYGSYYLQFEFVEIWERLQAWSSLLVQQFGWFGLTLGIVGLIVPFKPSRLYLFTLWTGTVYSLFAILYSSADSYVYLVPFHTSFAIWIGLGSGYVLKHFSSHSSRLGAGLLIAGYILFHAAGYAGQVDASKDLRAERFGRLVMSEVPKDALVFVKGDRAVFTVWYFHLALEERPDAIVVADELLHFDWYQETLRDTYPALEIPGPLPWAQNLADANPSRPACFVQYTDRAKIDCIEAAGSP